LKSVEICLDFVVALYKALFDFCFGPCAMCTHNKAVESCPAHNFVIWSRISKIFHRNDNHIETTCRAQIWVTTLKDKVTTWPCSKIVSGQLLCYLKSNFTTILQEWSSYWENVSHAIFGSLPWRSKSQHDLAAKLCPAHNFVIWSRI